MLRMPVVENVDMHTYTKFDQTVPCFSFVVSISLTSNRQTGRQTDRQTDRQAGRQAASQPASQTYGQTHTVGVVHT